MIVQEPEAAGPALASASAAVLVWRLLLAVVGLAVSVLLSRGLGPEGRGEYFLLITAAGTLVVLCKLGLEQANVYLLGARRLSFGWLAGQNGLVSLAMGAVGIAVLGMAWRFVPTLSAGTPQSWFLLAGLTIPAAIHTQLAAGLLILQGRVTWPFRTALFANAGQAVLLLGLLVGGRLTVGPALGVYLVTTLLTWVWTVSAQEDRGRPWIRWHAGLLRETLRQALPLHLAMLLLFLHLRMDMFMVKSISGTAALGQYSLSVVLAETVLLVTDSLAIAVLPRQMSKTLEGSGVTALRGARTNSLIGVGIAALWIAAGSTVIRIFFGTEFAPAYPPLVALLPGMVFLGMQRVCGAPLVRTGRSGRLATIYALSLLLNILLNLRWIPAWGPLGAGLASSVSYGLGALLILGWTARVAKVPFLPGIIAGRADWSFLWGTTRESLQALQQTRLARKQAPPNHRME